MNQPNMEFGGFVPPTSNYVRMPGNWTDITAEINNLAELKVVEYVLRHTWGYQEYDQAKTISVDEFMYGRKRADGSRMDNGTRLSEQSVRNGLSRAIKDGFLTCIIDTHDKARMKKSYALKMHVSVSETTLEVKPLEVKDLDPLNVRGLNSRGLKVRPQPPKDLTPDPQHVDLRPPKFRPRTEKETIETYSEKNTEERKRPVSSVESPSSLPSDSFSPSARSSSLSEQEAVVWQWWKTKKSLDDSALTPATHEHLAVLAEHFTAPVQLESLYQFVSEELERYAASQNRPWVAPHLKNLVKRFPAWNEIQTHKTVAPPRKIVSGSGSMTNWTRQRLEGKIEAPPVVYAPVRRRSGKPMNNLGTAILVQRVSMR